MARKHLTLTSCDRCGKTIEEAAYAGTEADESKKPKVYIESRGVGHDDPIRYDDLCTACSARVIALMEQISKTGKTKSTPDKSPGEKPLKGGKK